MPSRAKRFCKYPGCNELTTGTYCNQHKRDTDKEKEARRGSAYQRGYTYRWGQYSKRFLQRPENTFCKLQLDGCTNIADCVDHIDPPDGPNDPRFWDTTNHQAACIHCNSVKGHRNIKGDGKPFQSLIKG